MTTAIVLGAGMVGSVIAADLADDFEVTLADISASALGAAKRRTPLVTTVAADLSDPDVIRKTVAPFDVVLGALPSRIGHQALRAVIEAGRNYCDISFMAEDPMDHDALARRQGVTAVVDCGVAPGLSNMIAGHAVDRLDPCEKLSIYVGGIPRVAEGPFQYKAAFSPSDVIQEYVRPARLVDQGRVVVHEALSEIEPISFAGVGALEAFNTDGLRTLVTLNVPFMKEKTIRYSGHARLMRALRDAGFFSSDPITVSTVAVRPLEVTEALLFPRWTYEEGEQDMTLMRVIAVGESGESLTWEMIDVYDETTATSSMARTTAFPCAITARMIVSGQFDQKGVIAPEQIGRVPGLLDHVLGELESRRVRVRPV